MYINGKSVKEYGAVLLGSPRISPASVSHETFIGRNRTNISVLGYDIGLKSIEVTLGFFGESAHEVQIKRSTLRGALLGELDLFFEYDGFFYFAVYQSDGELESEYKNMQTSVIKFTGVQHEQLVRSVGNVIYCASTCPETDCKLTSTVETTAASYVLGNAAFSDVTAGDVLVFDGIDGKVTKNGSDVSAAWTKFNRLVPGKNTINCTGTATVEYYPTHM